MVATKKSSKESGDTIGFVPFARLVSVSQLPKQTIPETWDEYPGTGNLSDWQRFMFDLGIPGHYSSKNQCRKVLKHVWVNIVDFFEATKAGLIPRHFNSQNQLGAYTRRTKKFYPKNMVPKGSPLRCLFSHIVHTKSRH
ncbi:hypothetical protein F4776DRAFT_661865 [Hypoxylon sp. NC0597]|nr:hypothetical protein F4776DRAFT_661865 [Hypoxylon sp. NC0597]